LDADIYAVCTWGGATNVDLGHDADAACVAFAERVCKGMGVVRLDQVHGATAKTASGEARADQPGQSLG
jgi:hypothetical protein